MISSRRKLVVLVSALLAWVLQGSPVSAEGWPTYRHDARRTARQTLAGDIDVPAVGWSFSRGGRLGPGEIGVADVNLDREPEAVLLRGGRAVARRFDGTVVWISDALSLSEILAITDFDGDGRPEVFAGSFWRGLLVLEGATGRVVWSTEDLHTRLGSVFPLDADGDGEQELYVADDGCSASGHGTGRIYSFPHGFGDGISSVELDVSAHGYWCGAWQTAGDVDGDGLPEVLTLSHDALVVYDARTGDEVAHSPSGAPFPYGSGNVFAGDVDGDGRDEAVVAINNPAGVYTDTRRLLLYDIDDSEATLRWEVATDGAEGWHSYPWSPIADVIPGGAMEVATSMYDPDAGWSIMVFEGDAAEAIPAVEIPGQALLALVDLDADGTAELLAQESIEQSLSSFGALSAIDVTAEGDTSALWTVEAAAAPLTRFDWARSLGPALLATPETVIGLALELDRDEDFRADAVTLGLPPGPAAPVRDLGAVAPAGWVAAVSPTPAPNVIVARTDGSVELLDAGLELVNDTAEPIGVADLSEMNLPVPGLALGVVPGAGGPIVFTMTAASRLVALEVAPGRSDLEVRWMDDAFAAGPIADAIPRADGGWDVATFARSADDSLHVNMLTVDAGTQALDVELADVADIGPAWGLVPLAGTEGWPDQAIVTTYDRRREWMEYQSISLPGGAIHPLPGLSRVVTGGWDWPGSAWDRNGDGVDDFWVFQSSTGRVADGASGEVVVSQTSTFVGLASFVDLDGDEVEDILHDGSRSGGPRRLDSDLLALWETAPGVAHLQGAALPTSTGDVHVATTRYGSAWLEMYEGADGSLVLAEVLAGGEAYPDEEAALAADATLGVLSNVTAADDLTGAGTGSFLVGSSDGHVYAISAEDGTLDWSLNLRVAVGEPFAADVDGDGSSEVVAPAGDGRIYVIGRATLAAPELVYDTDGSFVALTPDQDLDEIEQSTNVGANWDEVAGATSYEYSIVTEDDVVVVPWTDSGGATRFSLAGLALQLGERYYTIVRAQDRSGPSPRVSVEVSSDGFVVLDRQDPVVMLEAEPSTIFPHETGPLSGADLTATATDQVGLSSLVIVIMDASDEPVRDLASVEIGGTEYTETFRWDGRDDEGDVVPAGSYDALATVRDLSGRMGEARATIMVCDERSDSGPCAGGDGDADADELDADGDSDADGGTGRWHVRGGACACRAEPRGPDSLGGWALAGVVATVFFRMRRQRTKIE
jgi:outer membrane protein assembly factor BamB